MTHLLYDASIPVFCRYLKQLSLLLELAATHARAGGLLEASVLQSRLAPNMLSFSAQVETAAYFSLRACFPLAGQAVPAYGEFASTFVGLQLRISHYLMLIDALDAKAFENAEKRMINAQAGQASLLLPAPEFLFQFALPNFFFHFTTAYAILRHIDVPIGKQQFDGYHAYA
jgi:uncharacterized protein